MEPREFGEWIERIGGNHDEQILLRSREEYQSLTGQIFQDDKSYESRMELFFEWFTIDRPLQDSGMTPLEKFLDNPANAGEQSLPALKEAMGGNLHTLFQVMQLKQGELRVRDLFDEKEYRVQDREGGIFFNRSDVFEGRLIRIPNNSFFSGNFVYHPPESVKFIKLKIKTIQAEEKEKEKLFKGMEKELVSLDKKKAASEKELTKLSAKIEKARKPEKREVLEQEKRTLEERGRTLSRELQETNLRVQNFKAIQLGIELRKKRFELIQKLSYMSLKWERSRQIALSDIYKD